MHETTAAIQENARAAAIEEPRRRGAISPYLAFSVFVAGASTLGAEMAAPRLLAPSFGTTQIIWTNIIGTVLAAMTLGAIVGGRLADRWPSEHAYARALAVAGLLLAAVPLLSGPVLSAAAGAMAQQRLGTLLLSLGTMCLFFAPPVFLLGMIGPWAVRLGGAERTDLGRVAGWVFGLGSVGSIVGTFGTSLVAIPLLGTRRTLLAMGVLLLLAGAWRAWKPGVARLVAATLAAGLFLLPQAVPQRAGTIYEDESLYNFITVTLDERGWTRLLLNEGIGYQSVKPPRGVLTGGVFDHLSVLPAMLPQDEELRVLVLGLAAGTLATQLEHFYGRERALRIDGVEIDGAVIDAGRRFFELDRVDSLRIHVDDARRYLATSPDRYHLIVVDAYQGFYVPFHLATREFYEQARNHLEPGGMLAVNLASSPGGQALRNAFATTLDAVFSNVARFEIPHRDVPFSNYVYVASAQTLALPEPRTVDAELHEALAAIEQTWSLPTPSANGMILADDQAPVELLTDWMVLRWGARHGGD